MWENIIQSITKVRYGDKGLGCILAHTMDLGKTFQVYFTLFFISLYSPLSTPFFSFGVSMLAFLQVYVLVS